MNICHKLNIFQAISKCGGGFVAKSCPTLCDPMDCSPPASSVHEILRQEYWSGLPCPPPEALPNTGIKLASLMFLYWQVSFLPLAPPGKPHPPGVQNINIA